VVASGWRCAVLDIAVDLFIWAIIPGVILATVCHVWVSIRDRGDAKRDAEVMRRWEYK
jgi:hypothetical protein